jgi:hypothetical protein
MYTCLHIYCPLFLSDLMKTEFSRQIFEKRSNVKYHENTSSGSRVVPCGRVNRQTGQAGMTKLRVTFSNFPKAQKKKKEWCYHAAWKDRVSHPTNEMHGSKSKKLSSSLHTKAVIHSIYDHQLTPCITSTPQSH